MREDDLASAERASAATFFEAESSTRRVNDPQVEPRSAAASKQWIDRMRFFLDVDPGGCWVAVQDGAGVWFPDPVRWSASPSPRTVALCGSSRPMAYCRAIAPRASGGD